jgi:hypothetical protein
MLGLTIIKTMRLTSTSDKAGIVLAKALGACTMVLIKADAG